MPIEPENVEIAVEDITPVDLAAVDSAFVLSVDCPVQIPGSKANKIGSELIDSCLIYKMLSNKLVGMVQRYPARTRSLVYILRY